MNIVLKIGGSVLFSDNEINTPLIKKYTETINVLKKTYEKIGIVVGGGIYARNYIKAAKKLNATADFQDFLGIEISRQNARLLISALTNVYDEPPKDYNEFKKASSMFQIVVLGGFQPGQSTNGVAAIVAEHLKAEYLINLSDVDQVYNKDPDKFKDAKPLTEISYYDFYKIIINNEQSPGKYALFDLLGFEIIKRSNIKLLFLNGKHPELIHKALTGSTIGTVIK